MNLEIQSFNLLSSATQADVAELLSAYTNGQLGETPQMLPVTEEVVHSKYAGFVALQAGELAGYIGAAQPEEWNGVSMPEVGSLWVPKQFRKRGIAHKLLSAISTQLVEDGVVPYAFCNSLSEVIFKQTGYEDALPTEVPPSAFSLCAACPMKPAQGCCDKVVIFSGERS